MLKGKSYFPKILRNFLITTILGTYAERNRGILVGVSEKVAHDAENS